MDFTPKRVVEVEVFTVDYGPRLATGETIISAVWSVSVVSGVDPTPGAMLSGNASFQGSQVSQMLQGGVAGVTYAPICTALTSQGQILVLPDPGTGYLLVKANG